jgi:hypothetical protein
MLSQRVARRIGQGINLGRPSENPFPSAYWRRKRKGCHDEHGRRNSDQPRFTGPSCGFLSGPYGGRAIQLVGCPIGHGLRGLRDDQDPSRCPPSVKFQSVSVDGPALFVLQAMNG